MLTAEEMVNRIEALERKLSLNTENTFRPTPFDYEREVPLVENLRAGVVQNLRSNSVVLDWVVPEGRNDIESFEIWSKDLTAESPAWVKKGEVTNPPWSDTIISDRDATVTFSVRTRLRNGLGTTIENSATVPVAVTEPDDSITQASQIANGIVGDSKFDRLVDPITIGTVDIANAAITNAKILSLDAGKITTGSLAAGIAVLGTVLAGQIQAGTISAAITMTSPHITSTSGAKVVDIENGVLTIQGSGDTTTIDNGNVNVSDGGTSNTDLTSGGLSVIQSGNALVSLSKSGGTSGLVRVRDGAAIAVETGVSGGIGYVSFEAGTSYALWTDANQKEVHAGQATLSSGSVTVATGLSSVTSFVATVGSGGTPSEYLGWTTPSGGSVTVNSSNTSSSATIYWFAYGAP